MNIHSALPAEILVFKISMIDTMDSINLPTIEAALDGLEGKESLSESTVRFFRDLIRVQSEIKSRLHDEHITFSLSEDEIKEKLRQGTPLISPEIIPFNNLYLKELFSRICEIMKRSEQGNAEALKKLLDAENSGDLPLETLTRKLLSHESTYFSTLSKKLTIGEDLLLFIALNLAKPFCEALAEKITVEIGENEWLRHYCPFCGSTAHIARLEKETGRKILSCQLCSSEWRYMRIKCPFCCNEKQKSMRFLEVEGSPYRLDFCDQCRRYIKTFDERKGGDGKGVFIPSVEDLSTMYLDILAGREGYVRSCFFPPSVDALKVKGKKETRH